MAQPGKEEGTRADAPGLFTAFLWMGKNPKQEREEREVGHCRSFGSPQPGQLHNLSTRVDSTGRMVDTPPVASLSFLPPPLQCAFHSIAPPPGSSLVEYPQANGFFTQSQGPGISFPGAAQPSHPQVLR